MLRVRIYFFILIFLVCNACQKPPSTIAQKPSAFNPTNAFILTQASPKMAWKALQTIFVEESVALEVLDESQGIYSTKIMIDAAHAPLQKFRLSGTIHATPEGTKITVYKSTKELGAEKEWLSVLSDGIYERHFLEKLHALLEKIN